MYEFKLQKQLFVARLSWAQVGLMQKDGEKAANPKRQMINDILPSGISCCTCTSDGLTEK
jgi:hypothetical protein